jgi:hypothetical protein
LSDRCVEHHTFIAAQIQYAANLFALSVEERQSRHISRRDRTPDRARLRSEAGNIDQLGLAGCTCFGSAGEGSTASFGSGGKILAPAA